MLIASILQTNQKWKKEWFWKVNIHISGTHARSAKVAYFFILANNPFFMAAKMEKEKAMNKRRNKIARTSWEVFNVISEEKIEAALNWIESPTSSIISGAEKKKIRIHLDIHSPK